MKKSLLCSISIIVGAALLATGCGRQEDTEAGAADTEAEIKRLNEEMLRESEQASQAATDAVDQATTATTDAVATNAANNLAETNQAGASVENLLDQARTLISEKRYAEALTLLQQQVASLQLTPEQRNTVDELIAKAKTALGQDAVSQGQKAVGDLLNRKE